MHPMSIQYLSSFGLRSILRSHHTVIVYVESIPVSPTALFSPHVKEIVATCPILSYLKGISLLLLGRDM